MNGSAIVCRVFVVMAMLATLVTFGRGVLAGDFVGEKGYRQIVPGARNTWRVTALLCVALLTPSPKSTP